MKIGVMSDSHDNMPNVTRAVALFDKAGCAALVHAGDIIAPFTYKELLKFAGGPVHAIFGNNDGERRGLASLGDIREGPLRIDLGGRTVVVVHEREKATADIVEGADVVVYGHDHTSKLEGADPLWLNPGETFGLLKGKATAAVLDMDNLSVEFVEL